MNFKSPKHFKAHPWYFTQSPENVSQTDSLMRNENVILLLINVIFYSVISTNPKHFKAYTCYLTVTRKWSSNHQFDAKWKCHTLVSLRSINSTNPKHFEFGDGGKEEGFQSILTEFFSPELKLRWFLQNFSCNFLYQHKFFRFDKRLFDIWGKVVQFFCIPTNSTILIGIFLDLQPKFGRIVIQKKFAADFLNFSNFSDIRCPNKKRIRSRGSKLSNLDSSYCFRFSNRSVRFPDKNLLTKWIDFRLYSNLNWHRIFLFCQNVSKRLFVKSLILLWIVWKYFENILKIF